MSLATLLPTLLSVGEQLKTKGVANEANTRHHLIEPLLGALGWNLNDFNEVDRELKVYDGTYLDYALRVDGKPKLFIEAKALGKSLADKQFIAQTVNYANNEGVVWCVLTNGITYHIYKSNEPVPMERKLLFELDLNDEDKGQLADSLQILSKLSIADGRLDTWGESVFVDMRTRSALGILGKDPNGPFVNAVSAAVEGPKIEPARLRASLARVLGSLAGDKLGAVVGTPPTQLSPIHTINKPIVPGYVTKAAYTVQQHTANMPSAIVDLFQQVDGYALSLGDDVERRPVKQYVGYFAGKRSFFTLELKKVKIYAYISITPSEAQPWDKTDMRDATKIGHYGMGDTEFVLRSSVQIARLKAFIHQSYLRNRK